MNKAALTAVGQIAQRTSGRAALEHRAVVQQGLDKLEEASLKYVARLIGNQRILDIGIGTGRTVTPLREHSRDYVGVDFAPEKVAHCQRRYPGVRFAQVDPRSMTAFADGSFDLAFFSGNGISMVDHAERLAILSEVRRVLAPEGTFIFSTCNRQSPLHRAKFSFPAFEPTGNPLKLAVRAGSFFGQTTLRAANRAMNLLHESQCGEYAVIGDASDDYRTMLYLISPEEQVRQLRNAKFTGDLRMFGQSGEPADFSNDGGTMGFVVRKRRAA